MSAIQHPQRPFAFRDPKRNAGLSNYKSETSVRRLLAVGIALRRALQNLLGE